MSLRISLFWIYVISQYLGSHWYSCRQLRLSYRFWAYYLGLLAADTFSNYSLRDWLPEFIRYWVATAQLFCAIRTQRSHILRREALCGTSQMDFLRAEQCLLLQVTLTGAYGVHYIHCTDLFYTMQQHSPIYSPCLPAYLGLNPQQKMSLFCPCLLIVFSLFPSPFAAVFKLSSVRGRLTRVEVGENSGIVLCSRVLCSTVTQPFNCWRL